MLISTLTCYITVFLKFQSNFQVTTLVNKSNKLKKRRSKKGPEIANEIELATFRLVEVGESIANDFPEIKQPILDACKEAKISG